MNVVIDTNILFSALLSKGSSFRRILMSKENNFYAPKDLMIELLANRSKIVKYTKENPDNLDLIIFELFSQIEFIDDAFISNQSYEKAYSFCKEYDEKDTPFVALALELDAFFWTGDKIKDHLISNGFTKIFEY